MALHEGLDTVSIASLGFYSEIYGVGEEANVANLYVTFGYIEDLAEEVVSPLHRIPKMPYMPTIPVVKT